MNTYVTLWLYLAEFFLQRELFRINIIDRNKTHFMFNSLFPKIVLFMR